MPAGHISSPQPDASTELKCLGRALIPMSEDSPASATAKLTALIMVGVWAVITLSLTFAGLNTSVPPYWVFYTALVFLIIGKLWDIEVQKILPN